MSIPYEGATSGRRARDETIKMLRKLGCSNVGFMDDFAENSVLLAFTHNGRSVQLRASAKGWANMYLKENPWNFQRRSTQQKYNEKALLQGQIAVDSVLRDWVKGQVTAIETGILSFEAVFLPHMLTGDGVPLIDHLQAKDMLPPPEAQS